MATPYRYTPRAPHPTPISVAKEGIVQRRATRPPTVNPFQKFSQNDFESWISGITGSLRKALGQEVEVGETPQQSVEVPPERVEGAASGIPYQAVSVDTEGEEDEYLEDSFAYTRVRQNLNKGKGRDLREGPGLGNGFEGQKEEPIEILSGSEEDEVVQGEEDEGEDDDNEGMVLPTRGRYAESGEEVAEEDEDDLELYEDDEGVEEFLEEGGSRNSSPHKTEHMVYAAHREEILRAMRGQYVPREDEEYEEYGSSDLEEVPANQRHNRQQESPEVIELDLDLDDEPQPVAAQPFDDEQELLHRDSSPPKAEDERDVLDEEDAIYSYDVAKEGELYREDVDAGVEVGAEFVGSGDEEEVLPLDDDDAFPPRTQEFVEEELQEPDIRDPWSGPRTYAEDFYSGGDRPLRHIQIPDAHRLEDQQEEADDVEPIDEDGKDEDEVFVPETPQANDHPMQVELRDVWAGQEAYAEDYYSAGNFNLGPEQAAQPDRLGSELLNAEPEIISIDDDDGVEEGPATSLPLAAFQGTLGQSSLTPQTSLVEPLGHAFSGTLQGALGGAEGVVEPSRELQDAELMETDFDLEYPELSRPASVTEVAAQEETPLSVEAPAAPALRDAEEHSAEELVLLGSGEFAAQDFAETDDGRAELNAWKEEDTGNVGAAKHLPVSDGGDSDMENHHNIVEVFEGKGEGQPVEVESVGLRDEKEDEGMLGAEPSGSLIVPHSVRSREGIPEPESLPSNVEVEAVESHGHGIISTTHHTVTMEEFRDEDADAPIPAPSTADTIMGAVDKDSVGEADILQEEEAELDEPAVDDAGGDYGMDDHEDEDAYGEPENEDIEVLSITSSDDFRLMGHVEDGGEVEEPNEDEVSMDLAAEEHVVVTDDACPIGETSPLAEFGEPFSSVVEDIQNVTEDDVTDEFPASPSLKRATGLPGDEDQVEPEPLAPPLTAVDEPEPSEIRPTEDTITGGRPDEDLPDESLPEQPHETTPEVKHDSGAEPSDVDSISVSGAISEENGESPLAEVQGLAFDGDADMKDLDAPTAPEGEEGSLPKAEPPAEGTLDGYLVVDGAMSARATSPPESVLEEDKSHDYPPVDDSIQALSESEASPEPPILLARTTIIQREITQSTGTPFAAFEEYSAVLSAPDIDSPVLAALPSQASAGAASFPVVLYAPLPETANEFPAADDQDFSAEEGEVLMSEAQQSTQTETEAEDVGNPNESDVPDANYLPPPQSIDEVTMEVDSGSPRAVQPPDSSSTTADDPSHSVIDGTSEPTPIAKPGPSAEAVELPAEREPSAPREVAAPPQDMPVQPTSMSDEKLTIESTNSATTSDPLEIPSQEQKPGFRTISLPPPTSPSASTTKPPNKPNAGKRKRDGPSPKKGSRGGAATRKKSTRGKGKGKQVDDAPLDGEEIVAVPRKRSKLTERYLTSVGEGPRPPVSTSATSVQSGSSASSAARLLQPSSRASSVAASEASGQTQPSPTTSKPPGFPKTQRGSGGFVHYNLVPDSQPQAPSPLLQATSAAQRPFLHAHGKRKVPLPLQTYRTMPAPAAVPVPVVQQPIVTPQTQIQAPPHLPRPLADQAQHGHARRLSGTHRTSIPPPSPSSSHPPTSPQSENPPQTPTNSIAHVSQAPTPQGPTPASGARRTQSMKVPPLTTHTPVTRSHCRFHKISLPKEELGPRIFFIVPGCSLTRYKVIEDEEVEDHGDATYEESQHMVEDIETLDLDPYIIKVLKSLVGSEIMQQREVYYLPLPGENVVRQPSTSTANVASITGKGRASGVPSASISARGKIGGDTTLEDLGISDTESDDKSSDDSDYEAKPVARTKQTARKGPAPRKPTKASNKRSRAAVAQDSMQVDEAEEGRDAKKTKLDESQSSQPLLDSPVHIP